MRVITVTKAGRVVAVDDEREEAPTGDADFLERVAKRIEAATGYDPDRIATAMQAEADAMGAVMTQEGELDPIPDDAVA
jgi:hypothetical protein